MLALNINADAFVVAARKLERTHRSALPVAVRQTLNDAAFDVKKTSLQKSASKNFTQRSPQFFKTFSAVNKASGFNINTMKAEVGMNDRGKVSARTAVKNMDKQEQGGKITDGARYLKDARKGDNKKSVTRSNYFQNGRVLTGPSKRRTAKSDFVAKAFASKKYKAKFFHKGTRGGFWMQVTSVRKLKDGSIKINARKLMMSRQGSPADIKATHFMREAAGMTLQRIGYFFHKNAKVQFDKYR